MVTKLCKVNLNLFYMQFLLRKRWYQGSFESRQVQIRCVAVNGEQLVLGCFNHKGLHHAATKLATSISSCLYCCIICSDTLRQGCSRSAKSTC